MPCLLLLLGCDFQSERPREELLRAQLPHLRQAETTVSSPRRVAAQQSLFVGQASNSARRSRAPDPMLLLGTA